MQAAKPNPTEATPIHKIVKNKPIIRVPGCPPIGEVMAGIIVHVVAFGRLPKLDRLGRPKAFYAKRVHDSCYRRPYYDAGLFAETFDDQNAKNGYSCKFHVNNYSMFSKPFHSVLLLFGSYFKVILLKQFSCT